MRLSNPLLLASLGVMFVSASCTLITDVDRSKIPDGTATAGTSGVGGDVMNPPVENGGGGMTPANGGAAGEGTAASNPGGTNAGGAGATAGVGDGGSETAGGAVNGGAPAAGADAGGTPNDVLGGAGNGAGS
jgi:hypothetical protein